MYLNKKKFLKSELGCSLDSCIRLLDNSLTILSRYPYGSTNLLISDESLSSICDYAMKCVESYFAQWAIYKMAIKQFYCIEYHFTRTDEYFGLVTEDETDWLIKIER